MSPHFNLASAFDAIVAENPQRTALFYPADALRVSYGELQQLVARVATQLQARGLKAGQVLALFHDKSPQAYATMLACLRLGIIYTNLDPDSPWERLHKILSTCQPALIANGFADTPCAAELAETPFRDVLQLRQLPEETPASSAVTGPTGGAPAYIMFTSGSTGNPKGAVMSHANVLWFIAWAQQRFNIQSLDVLTNVNPMYFDNSVFDFYAALFSGATLVPFSAAQVRDTRSLVRLINQARCTLWFSVPSMLTYLLTTRALSTTDFPTMRSIVFGGEGFPKRRLRELYELFGSRVRLENVYGPTECTCICSAYAVQEQDFEDMQSLAPLGALAPNFDFEILKQHDDDADIGELFLRGPQVGLGYYNDPERTACAFIQNPRHSLFADVGYRCGDLVQRDDMGRLHFKGRVDYQIKHMGYRIELEEIEAALSSLPGVLECAAIYQKNVDGLGQIIGFAALAQPSSADMLRSELAKLLPAYMLPRQIVLLDGLPKNANGKIDRLALRLSLQSDT